MHRKINAHDMAKERTWCMCIFTVFKYMGGLCAHFSTYTTDEYLGSFGFRDYFSVVCLHIDFNWKTFAIFKLKAAYMKWLVS